MIDRKGWIFNYEMARIITTIAMIKTKIRAKPDIRTS
jgi:hypothetical protein